MDWTRSWQNGKQSTPRPSGAPPPQPHRWSPDYMDGNGLGGENYHHPMDPRQGSMEPWSTDPRQGPRHGNGTLKKRPSPQKPKQETAPEQESLGGIFNRFGNSTSFQGIPFVARGNRWYAKAIWSVLFLAALGVCAYQLHSISDEYAKYKVTSKIEVGYDTLPFPSVTVCNVNPVRQSRVPLGGEELVEFVDALQPQEDYDIPNATKPDLDITRGTTQSTTSITTEGETTPEGTTQLFEGDGSVRSQAECQEMCVGGNCFPSEVGGFACQCDRGVTQLGPFTCVEDDGATIVGEGAQLECQEMCQSGSCIPNEVVGGFTCRCDPGYIQLVPFTCIEEGATGGKGEDGSGFFEPMPLEVCQEVCEEIDGNCIQDPRSRGYSCQCKPGYIMTDFFYCEDIDECLIGHHECTNVCHNSPGGYSCTCGDGSMVLDVDNKTCIYPPGTDYNPFKDLGTVDTDYDAYIVEDDLYDSEGYGDGEVATEFAITEEFKDIISEIQPSVRAEMGHQKETMILSCAFNGRVCSVDDFVLSLNPKYGNCYTFNHPDNWHQAIKSKRSGSQYGLNLLLYTESHESVDGLSDGQGIRLDIHPFNTKAFVEENGVSAAPGTATYMGVRLVNITRKDSPYGDCEDGETYEAYYNRTYTVDGCLNTCLDRKIHELCSCYRSEYSDYLPVSSYLQKTGIRLEPCSTEDEKKCEYHHRASMEVGQEECGCKQACHSTFYDIEQSHNSWPDNSFWFSLVNRVCQTDEYGCWSLQQAETVEDRYETLRKNFITLRVYYRDLNFETISEVPSYELSQFLSDFGGTLGLWVGASILTLAEVMDLIVQLCAYCTRNRSQDRPRRRTRFDPSMNGQLGQPGLNGQVPWGQPPQYIQ